MKILQIARLAALFLCVFVQSIQTEQKTPSMPEISAEEKEFISNLFSAGLSCTQQINQIIERMAILINKNHIKGLTHTDREKIKNILKIDREILNGLLSSISSIKTPADQIQITASLLSICDAFIVHLEENIASKFKKIEPFNPNKALNNKRSNLNNLTPDKLPKALQEIHERIQKLSDKADKAGLTWYNIYARSLDKHIVTPWNKYHGTTTLFFAGGAALLGSFLIMTTCRNAQNEHLQKLYKFLTYGGTNGPSENNWWSGFGEMIDRNPQSGKLMTLSELEAVKALEGQPTPLAHIFSQENVSSSNTHRLLPLGIFMINDTLKQHYPIVGLGGGLLLKEGTETWINYIRPWIQQRQSLLWNKLRGGAYMEAQIPSMYSIDPKVNFDDMTGLDEIKEAFSTIINYIENPEQFSNAGAKPETGWLLTGPTRTGKSFSFECLCGEILKIQKQKGLESFKFWKLEIDMIKEHTIQGLLSYAKANAPMVVFIDEIDLLGLQRIGDNKVLHDFLTALQSTKTEDPSKVVIVMAATNSPETLDKALRQYGRFGKEIRFEYPSFKYRKQYIIKELNNMALNPDNFDIDALVAKTNQKSYEDIQAIIRSAMTTAWSLHIPLTQELLEKSINKEIRKIIMIDRKELPEHELRILASHFAGKALAMLHLDTHAKLDCITTKAIMTELEETSAWYVMHAQNNKDENKKIVHGGIFTKTLHDTLNLKTQDQIVNEVKVLLAGFVAEEILLGSCGIQCHKESYAKAYDILDLLVFEGTDPNQLSKTMRNQLHDKAYNLRTQYKHEVKELLMQHRDALAAIADELLKNPILTDKEVQTIIDTVENKVVDTSSEAIAEDA